MQPHVTLENPLTKKSECLKKKKITYKGKTAFKSDCFKQHGILQNNGAIPPRVLMGLMMKLFSHMQDC